MSTQKNTLIGFVGLGVMGNSMAKNLVKNGYKLVVYNRTKERANELQQLGARWVDSVDRVANQADVIITMVGLPSDVEEVYLGEHGILNHSKAGTYVIDMTTSTPSLATQIYQRALENQIYALDAPVSGGDIGARTGKLSIMVGGDHDAFEVVYPILETMGNNIVLQGQAGAGQHTKMCNQIAIASNMMGVCEAMAYAKNAGLDPLNVLKSIGTGAAASWSLTNLAPRMILGDFEPGFYVKHFIKDMKIALEAAASMNLQVPGLELAKSLYDRLVVQGDELLGTQALFKLYEENLRSNSW